MPTSRDYPHILGRVFNTPLALHPDKAAALVAVLGGRLGFDAGQIAHAQHVAEGAGNVLPQPLAKVPGQIESDKSYAMTRGGVAVIPLLGTLVHRAAAAAPPSMFWSYGEIADMFAAAMADPMVKAILFDINSGGGEVSGAFDLARQIHAQRGNKPIWAAADEHAYSAAYAIASAADRITVAETGGVGSIGVIAMHLDVSIAEKSAGLTYTTVFSGARKNDFNPHEKLSPTAHERLKADVSDTYELFVAMAAAHRGVTPDVIRATEADTFTGINGQAVDAKLADAVMPFAETLAELTAKVSQPSTNYYTVYNPGAGSAASQPGSPKENAMPNPANTAADTTSVASTVVDTQALTSAAVVAPAPAAAAVAPTVDVDADALRAEGVKAAAQIAQLCQLAGASNLTADYLGKGMNADQVRADLTQRRAAQDALTAVSANHSGGVQPQPAATLDIAAVFARMNKSVRR